MINLDPMLVEWRARQRSFLEGKSDDDLLSAAKTMQSVERIQVFDKYRQIRQACLANTGIEKNSIAENKWVLTLLSADRADAVRSRASNLKDAKKASNGTAGGPPPSLDDLLA